VTCPTPLVILTLFLIGRDGQIVRPVTPTDGCGLPQPQLLAALQLSDLKFQPLRSSRSAASSARSKLTSASFASATARSRASSSPCS